MSEESRSKLIHMAPKVIVDHARKIVKHDQISLHSDALVSVVVPVYNVSTHLKECLQSISNQTYKNLQIIVVDDGSTDDSLALARSLALDDGRIEVHSQSNAGLGAARNRGTQCARGRYLVFADSDDVVPKTAYAIMVQTLEYSGSDFLTGSLYRFNSTKHEVPKWCTRLHSERRIGINVSEYLDGLVNVYAWNKMYRKSVWDNLGMSYTEGVRYEDQEPSTRLFLLSNSFDVIPDPVYGYRLRDDQSSITQTKHLLTDVKDRVRVVEATLETIDRHGDELIKRAWIAKLIRYDLLPYIRAGIDGEPEYRDEVEHLCRLVAQLSDPIVWANSPVKVRSLAALVLSNQWSEIEEAILFNDETGAHVPTVTTQDELTFTPPFSEAIAPEYRIFGLRLATEETKLVAAAATVEHLGESKFKVRGWAFIKNLPTTNDQAEIEIRIWAIESSSGRAIELKVSRYDDSAITRWSGSKWTNYNGSGYEFTVDARSCREQGVDYDPGTAEWCFKISVQYGGFVRESYLDRLVAGGSINRPPVIDADRRHNWSWKTSAANGLRLVLRRTDFGVEPVISEDAGLLLALTGRESATIRSAQLRRGSKRIRGRFVSKLGREFIKFDYTDADLGNEAAGVSWKLEAFDRTGARMFCSLVGQLERTWVATDVAWRQESPAEVHLEVNKFAGWIGTAKFEGEYLVFEGFVPAGSSLTHGNSRLVLMSSSGTHIEAPLEFEGLTFKAIIPFSAHACRTSLELGGYSIRLASKLSKYKDCGYWGEIREMLPLELAGDNRRVRFSMTKNGNAWLSLSSPLRDNEAGAWNQKRLQSMYRSLEDELKTNTVLFHSYLGEQANDSALALAEYLVTERPELELVWAVANPETELPEGVDPVILHSELWYRLVATSGTLVNNIYFDPWFRSRQGQKYVQTWHGTPLKAINRSYWKSIGRSAGWIRRMDRQAAAWTHLISPSPYYSEIVGLESGFEGKLVETGYPRNDALQSQNAKDVRRKIRRDFGIDEDVTAILYAPTWRDSLSKQSWKAEMVSFLDLASFSDQLGEGYVTLLRGHGHNARNGFRSHGLQATIDVTRHHDINELYLAADVIVTDYSSVMFDAAVTRKPLLFFVPDLDEYAGTGRGMYLDLAEVAPGPVIFKQHELVREIQSIPTISTRYQEKYDEFIERFAPFDDGFATKRVVESIWPKQNRMTISTADGELSTGHSVGR